MKGGVTEGSYAAEGRGRKGAGRGREGARQRNENENQGTETGPAITQMVELVYKDIKTISMFFKSQTRQIKFEAGSPQVHVRPHISETSTINSTDIHADPYRRR